MPKPMRAILGAILLAGTIGLVTCQNVFIDASEPKPELEQRGTH